MKGSKKGKAKKRLSHPEINSKRHEDIGDYPTITKRELRRLGRQMSSNHHSSRSRILPSFKLKKIIRLLSTDALDCAICAELLLKPYCLPCGHLFCGSCLDDVSLSPALYNFCPVCRNQIGDTSLTFNKSLDTILTCFAESR